MVLELSQLPWQKVVKATSTESHSRLGFLRRRLRLAKSQHTKLGFLRHLCRLAKFGLARSRLRGGGLLAKIGHFGLSISNLTLLKRVASQIGSDLSGAFPSELRIYHLVFSRGFSRYIFEDALRLQP